MIDQKLNDSIRRLRIHAQKRLVFKPGIPKREQLSSYKKYLELENLMIKRAHEKNNSGRENCRMRSAMIDVVIENLFLAGLDLYITKFQNIKYKMAVVALGGYGRAELNPHSDIDIMFLYPNVNESAELTEFKKIIAEEVLYPLWDLGLKVGHSSRNELEVLEEINKEIQSKNAILESRIICGSKPLFESMLEKFGKQIKKDDSIAYVKQRLKDENKRHLKYKNNIYLQQPNIKNGLGGLRDYQNILWISMIKYNFNSFKDLQNKKFLREDEVRNIEHAYDFLLRTRNELHYLNKRPTDILNLEQQLEIANNLNYKLSDSFKSVTKFMQDYFLACRTIYSICELLKQRFSLIEPKKNNSTFYQKVGGIINTKIKQIDGFEIRDKLIYTKNLNIFKDNPINLIKVFEIAQKYDSHISIKLKYLIKNSIPLIDNSVIHSKEAAELFKRILSSPGKVYPILKEMHSLEVLGRYVPEFGRLTCLIQHEFYHLYTVDEHVLQTIYQLDLIFNKKSKHILYAREIKETENPTLLYVMLLLHDIGKSLGIKNHAENGIKMATPILERFHFKPSDKEKILHIIKNHLEMARFSQHYDLDDISTAISFSSITKNPELLRFLFLHTYCDSKGTAEALWNSHKETMHTTLFLKTLKYFKSQPIEGTGDSTQSLIKLKNEFKERVMKICSSEIPLNEIESHFDLLPERYFNNTEINEAVAHLEMINSLFKEIKTCKSIGEIPPLVKWTEDKNLGATLIQVVTWDRKGLFYKLSGAITLSDLSIVSTRAISRKDHISIDSFYVVDAKTKGFASNISKQKFQDRINNVFLKEEKLSVEIDALEAESEIISEKIKGVLSPFSPSVDVYHELSLNRTIIEVEAVDKIGLLYKIAKTISEKNFDITFAKVSTEKGIAIDTFYIEHAELESDEPQKGLLELKDDIKKIIH